MPIALNSSLEIDMIEDEAVMGIFNLTHHFRDPDNDTLEFEIIYQSHVRANINSTSGMVDLIPYANWSGEDHIIIEARDGNIHNGDWPTLRINLSVEQVNDPPEINYVNDELIGVDETFLIQGIKGSVEIITVMASDPDEIYGDEMEFSTNFLDVVGRERISDGDFQFELNTGRLSIFLNDALVGEHIFNITVTDMQDESHSVQIRLLVEYYYEIYPFPRIISPLDGEIVHQHPGGGKVRFIVDGGFEQYFNDFYIYTWNFGDGSEPIEHAEIEVEHHFSVTGNYTISFVVGDGWGWKREDRITITVLVDSYRSFNVNVTGRLVDEKGTRLMGAKVLIDNEVAGHTNDWGGFNVSVDSGVRYLKFEYDGDKSESVTLTLFEETDQDMGDVVFLPRKTEGTTSIPSRFLILVFTVLALILLSLLIIVFFSVRYREIIEE